MATEEPPKSNFNNETELVETPLKQGQQHEDELNACEVLDTLPPSTKVNLLLKIGKSAIQFGSAGVRVEEYLKSLLVAKQF
jgi:hypothetical protein